MLLWLLAISLLPLARNEALAESAPGAAAIIAGSYGNGPGGALPIVPRSMWSGPGGDVLVTDVLRQAIVRISPAGDMATVAGTEFSPPHDGPYGPYPLDGLHSTEYGDLLNAAVVGADGLLYVATENFHAVFRINPDGRYYQVVGKVNAANLLADGEPGRAGELASIPKDLEALPDGRILIALGDRVLALRPDGTVYTFAGRQGSAGFAGDGGQATSALFNGVLDMAVGGDGSVFVADSENRRVRRISPDGIVATVAGTGASGDGGDGGPASSATFGSPDHVDVGDDGAVYVADSANSRVRRIDPVSGIITGIAGNGTHVMTGDGGPATGAGLDLTTQNGAVAVVGHELLIAESATIHAVDLETGLISLRYGTGSEEPTPGLPGPDTYLHTVTAAAAAPDGTTVYAANARIERVNPNGNVDVLIGGYPSASALSTGSAPYAQAGPLFPADIAYTPDGALWMVENNRVMRAAGGVVTVIANGTTIDGRRLSRLSGVAGMPDGSVVVVDNDTWVVTRVWPDGHSAAVAGGGAGPQGGIPDGGPATSGMLNAPRDVATDTEGRVYIAETQAGRVRRVELDGTITTVAGRSDGLCPCDPINGDGGPALQARMWPVSLAVAPDGTIYIVDSAGNFGRVRRVDTAGVVTTIAPGEGHTSWDAVRAENGGAAASAKLDATSVQLTAGGDLLATALFAPRRVWLIHDPEHAPAVQVAAGAPTGLAAAPRPDSTLRVTWSAPATASARPVTGYTVTVTDTSTGTQQAFQVAGTGPGPFSQDTGRLPRGHVIDITVVAVNLYGAGHPATTSAELTDPVLVGLSISPSNATVTAGQTRQFSAQGTYDDGTQRDVTTEVAWSTGDPAVATIASAGLLTSYNVGTTSVMASLGSASASASLSVTYAVTGGGFSGGGSVDQPPTVNYGKAGRSYLVAWQLTDHQGNYVRYLSAVVGTRYVQVACATFSGAPGDALGAASTGTAGLRYDLATEHYEFNWKTPSTPGCYEFFVLLQYGGSITADFSFA